MSASCENVQQGDICVRQGSQNLEGKTLSSLQSVPLYQSTLRFSGNSFELLTPTASRLRCEEAGLLTNALVNTTGWVPASARGGRERHGSKAASAACTYHFYEQLHAPSSRKCSSICPPQLTIGKSSSASKPGLAPIIAGCELLLYKSNRSN